METKTKEWISKGRFDSTNSTFFHSIKLQNSEPPLKGYCKPFIGVESLDKVVMLEKMIVRLVNNGYLFGKNKAHNLSTVYIEYYFNGKFFGVPDEWIFTLYPDKFVYGNNQEINGNKRLYQFLNKLYDSKDKGVFEQSKIVHKPIAINESELFDYSKKKFKTERELMDFYFIHRQRGIEEGVLYNFVLKYKQYHNL